MDGVERMVRLTVNEKGIEFMSKVVFSKIGEYNGRDNTLVYELKTYIRNHFSINSFDKRQDRLLNEVQTIYVFEGNVITEHIKGKIIIETKNPYSVEFDDCYIAFQNYEDDAKVKQDLSDFLKQEELYRIQFLIIDYIYKFNFESLKLVFTDQSEDGELIIEGSFNDEPILTYTIFRDGSSELCDNWHKEDYYVKIIFSYLKDYANKIIAKNPVLLMKAVFRF